MNGPVRFTHAFVDLIPDRPEPGTIYICIQYATAVHLCACGCGNKTVTPLAPTDWKLTFDGESITLYPSIGNWGFPCRSHYWIRNDHAQPVRTRTAEPAPTPGPAAPNTAREPAALDAASGTASRPRRRSLLSLLRHPWRR